MVKIRRLVEMARKKVPGGKAKGKQKGRAVRVKGYTRKDGTRVKGYRRGKAGGKEG